MRGGERGRSAPPPHTSPALPEHWAPSRTFPKGVNTAVPCRSATLPDGPAPLREPDPPGFLPPSPSIFPQNPTASGAYWMIENVYGAGTGSPPVNLAYLELRRDRQTPWSGALRGVGGKWNSQLVFALWPTWPRVAGRLPYPPPKDIQVLIPGTCEYIRLLAKRYRSR